REGPPRGEHRAAPASPFPAAPLSFPPPPSAPTAAGLFPGLVSLSPLPFLFVRGRQIGRPADQFRHRRNERVEHGARGLPCRDLGVLGAELVAHLCEDCVEIGRQFGVEAALKFRALVGGSGAEPLLPCQPPRGPAAPRRPPLLPNIVRNNKRRVFPAETFARALDLFGAERIAVRSGGAGLGGRAIGDDRAASDKARPVARMGAPDRGG